MGLVGASDMALSKSPQPGHPTAIPNDNVNNEADSTHGAPKEIRRSEFCLSACSDSKLKWLDLIVFLLSQHNPDAPGLSRGIGVEREWGGQGASQSLHPAVGRPRFVSLDVHFQQIVAVLHVRLRKFASRVLTAGSQTAGRETPPRL